MKIIDAYWEKRNIGVESYEIVITEDDTVQAFLSQEQLLVAGGAQYIVVKVPSNIPDFLFQLPKADYTFVETSLALSLKKSNYVCPPQIARFDRNIEVKVAETADDRQRVYNEIAKGMFTTDRVAIDKNFSQTMANTRYINWMKDLVEQNNVIYEVFLQNRAIGFFQIKRNDDTRAQGILTGVYNEFIASGVGLLVMKKLYDTIWSSGYKIYYATVVSNNLKAIRSNLIFGSEIDNVTYHYVRHICRQ